MLFAFIENYNEQDKETNQMESELGGTSLSMATFVREERLREEVAVCFHYCLTHVRVTVKSVVANGAELSHLIQEPISFQEIYP